MSNGLNIQIRSQKDAIKFAKENPEEALGLVVWNHIELKQRCECRRAECDGLYVSRQWLKEKKMLLIGIFIGICLITGGASAGVAKLLGMI